MSCISKRLVNISNFSIGIPKCLLTSLNCSLADLVSAYFIGTSCVPPIAKNERKNGIVSRPKNKAKNTYIIFFIKIPPHL